jgi:hypothetical protein
VRIQMCEVRNVRMFFVGVGDKARSAQDKARTPYHIVIITRERQTRNVPDLELVYQVVQRAYTC